MDQPPIIDTESYSSIKYRKASLISPILNLTKRERDMEEIRIISTSTVHQATSDESTQVIELTSWDLRLLMVGSIQKGLLFLKPLDNSQHTLVNHLKTSLARTLDFFPPLAGRLVSILNDDSTTSFFINCNNAGAQFTHAIVDNLTIADILTPLYIPKIIHSFFPINGVLNQQGVNEPLLAVQVTELVDGFFIGCTINHSVVDGTSFWHFFNSWSEISRGLTSISKLPNLKRWFPNDTDCRARIPSSDDQLVMDTYEIPQSLQERVFHFTRESIGKLKAKANAEMGTNRISSLQALVAHLWRSIIRCRCIDTSRDTNLMLPIGARSRLRPPLPEGYFGNAVRAKQVAMTRSELLERGLGWVAWEINKVIASETDEELRKFHEDWVKWPKVKKMGVFTSTGLIVSSSPTFNMYGNDFGWGRPVAVRSGMANKFDGKVTLFAGVEEGSIDIEICLVQETLHAMGEIDKEFIEAVCS